MEIENLVEVKKDNNIDVILIRPRYNLSSSLYNRSGSDGRKESYPPLGLYYLEAKLQQGGYSVEIIDGIFLESETIFSRVREISPKIIGIYVVSSAIPEAFRLIRGLRIVSKAAVVLGGPHITHCPESIRYFLADYGIRGDGEESFLRLTKFLIRREGDVRDLHGVIFVSNGLLQISEKVEITDLDQLPFPDFKPAKESPYFFPLSSMRMTTMITSRGCLFDCVYCGLPNKRSFIARSVNNIIAELKVNIEKGYEYIDFKDDIFTYDMERIENLCLRIIEERIRFNWGCETRVDFLNEKLICLMKAAGCCNIKVGIETVVERVQRVIGKVIPLDKIEDSFQLIRRYNMDVIAYFSLGHPEETLLDMKETINVIRRLSPDYMDVALCSPIPGSRLFDIAVREGKLPKDFWDKVDKIEMLPVYIPAGLTLKDMRELQKQAYRKFYFNCNYIISQARKIKNLKDFKNKFKIALLLWKEACR